jgi:YVTN family beta-propeller protein
MTLIRSVVFLGAFAVITNLAAAQTPSRMLLVVVRGGGENSLAIVDPRSNEVVGRVPITAAGVPHLVAASDDGKLAFVTNNSYAPNKEDIPSDGSISVIDLAARKVLRTVELGRGSYPHGIVFAGGKVYFTAEGYKLVGRYDPGSNQIDWMQGTGRGGAHLLIVSKDQTKIFTTSTDPSSVIAIESWDPPADSRSFHDGPGLIWRVTAIPVGKIPEGIAMSPDEKELWVATRGDDGLSIIDVTTLKVLQTLNLKIPTPIRLEFTPDGKRVLIEDNLAGDILVLDAATRSVIKRFKVSSNMTDVQVKALKYFGGEHSPAQMHGLLMVPDGSRVYVDVLGGNRIDVLDLKTLEVTGSIFPGEQPEGMTWAETR